MKSRTILLLLPTVLLTLVSATLRASEPAPDSPWSAPRSLDNFAHLLARSPFALPTAEETSPLAERFALTGAFTLDGENHVFVIDKTTKVRERLTATPNTAGLQLVEFLPDADPRKMRATIRMGQDTGTIAFEKIAPPPEAAQPASQPGAKPTASVQTPQGTPTPPRRPTVRRVIRRTPISATSPASQ